MKICYECGRRCSSRLSVCPKCEAILEESFFIKIIFSSLAVGLAITLILSKLGHDGRGLVTETFLTATTLIILATVAWKLIQRFQDKARNPIRELVALYSDRMGRGLILAGLIAILLLEFGIWQPTTSGAVGDPSLLRQIRTAIIIGFSIFYGPCLIYFMRFGLIDLRKANGLIDYERSKLGKGS